MYPFRMYGQIVQLYHYKVDYTENEEPKTRYFPTEEEANYIANEMSGTVNEYDSTAFAWMEGLDVGDSPNTYAEAIKIYEMGEAEYNRQKAFEQAKRADQLRADLDYILLMGGY